MVAVSSPPTTIRWVTAFIDRPLPSFDAAADFWTVVSGTTLSDRRGDHRQFATLLPAYGDASVRVQGVDSGDGGAHVDLEVDNPEAMVAHAVDLGGDVAVRYDDGLVVVRSPAGLPVCVMPWSGATHPPAATAHGDGSRSRLDQVCLDIAPSEFAAEAGFWSRLTGWSARSDQLTEFARLHPAAGEALPVQILLQRADEERVAAAHLDLACSDPDRVLLLHEKHGAVLVRRHEHWIVMRDTAGGTYYGPGPGQPFLRQRDEAAGSTYVVPTSGSPRRHVLLEHRFARAARQQPGHDERRSKVSTPGQALKAIKESPHHTQASQKVGVAAAARRATRPRRRARPPDRTRSRPTRAPGWAELRGGPGRKSSNWSATVRRPRKHARSSGTARRTHRTGGGQRAAGMVSASTVSLEASLWDRPRSCWTD